MDFKNKMHENNNSYYYYNNDLLTCKELTQVNLVLLHLCLAVFVLLTLDCQMYSDMQAVDLEQALILCLDLQILTAAVAAVFVTLSTLTFC